jgi:hypothetical protein
MLWKYGLLARRGAPGDFVVLSSSEFVASDLADAKSLLAGVVTNVRAHASVTPNAIRLIDPSGEEIWRALIADHRPAVGRPDQDIHSRHHHWSLAQRKWRHY